MPFVDRPSASATFVLLDETGSRSTVQFDIPKTTLVEAAFLGVGGLRALIATLTNCAVISQSVTYSQHDTTPEVPAAGSRVERKGVFTFRTAAGKTATYQIPGIIPDVVTNSGRIDEDRPAVAAFVNALIAADVIFCDSNGSDLTSLKEAYERYRRTTRSMLPNDRKPDPDVVPDVG
jgi:hypothetical protein